MPEAGDQGWGKASKIAYSVTLATIKWTVQRELWYGLVNYKVSR